MARIVDLDSPEIIKMGRDKFGNVIYHIPPDTSTIETDEYIRGYTQAEYDIFHGGNYTPIKHGRWKALGKYDRECSCCLGIVDVINYRYCPNCGADMREVEE